MSRAALFSEPTGGRQSRRFECGCKVSSNDANSPSFLLTKLSVNEESTWNCLIDANNGSHLEYLLA